MHQSKSISAIRMRRHVLKMASAGNSVHIGCAFSLIEIVRELYGGVMRLDPTGPAGLNRDFMILSKGHGVMAIYAAYRELGWIHDDALNRYFSDGSDLHGLCEADVPGLEVCSGSLGHGLPIAVGMAHGLSLLGDPRRIFCIVGDGEMNEGPMWEALLFAGHHGLDNLTVIVDVNGFQAMAATRDIIDMEPFASKFIAFGCEARECDGHDESALKLALQPGNGRPVAVVARTVKGKGVSFMENSLEWHYLRLDDLLLTRAIAELDALEART